MVLQFPCPYEADGTVPVLFPWRVHCSHPRCGWSCPAKDEHDACNVLEQHLANVHKAKRPMLKMVAASYNGTPAA